MRLSFFEKKVTQNISSENAQLLVSHVLEIS